MAGLLHPLDPRQKLVIVKQRPLDFFPCCYWIGPTKFKAAWGRVYTTAENLSVILSLFKLANPKLGEEDAPLQRLKKAPAFKGELDFNF